MANTFCEYLMNEAAGPACGASAGNATPAALGFDAYCAPGEQYRCPLVLVRELLG